MPSALGGPYSCVVFDLDGTLLDTREAMLAAINSVLAEHALAPASAAQLGEALHFGLGAMLDRAAALAGAPALPAGAPARVREYYLQSAAQTVRLFAGARALLEQLQEAGIWLAACSNQDQAHAARLRRAFDLDGLFREVVGGDSLAQRKPDPLPLRWLMQRAGAAPAATLMVGDSAVDLSCAQRAGVGIALMAHGYGLSDIDGREAAPACFADFAALGAALLAPARPRHSTLEI